MIQKIIVPLFICMSMFTGCGQQNVADESLLIENVVDVEEQEQEQEEIKEPIDATLQIAMQNPITLNPVYNMDKSVQQNLYLIFDTLVNIEQDGSISPNIAESWVYAPEENAITVRLRDDVRWHDNEQLTADDVVYTLRLIQNAEESSYKICTENMINIQALDQQTVKITYRQTFSGVYQTLFFPVIPSHVYSNVNDRESIYAPIGTGAYRYVEIIPNKEMTLIANEAYFMGKPVIETIEVTMIPDEASELASFEQNLIDVIYTDIMNWGKYTKDKSATVHEVNTQLYEFIGLNFNNPLFQNQNIREALVYGLDREELLNTYLLGYGAVTDTPISPYSYLYDQTSTIKKGDEERAKLLLIEEGYVYDNKDRVFKKDGEPLSFNLLINRQNADRVAVAKGIQRMYKEIGIIVEIEEVDAAAYTSRIYGKQYEAFLGGWKLSYLPDLSFAFHSASIREGNNFISYNDPKMDELLGMTFNSSPIQIQEAYKTLQSYIAEQNPYISLFFRNAALITKNKVGGEINPTPLNIYANIEAWEIVE